MNYSVGVVRALILLSLLLALPAEAQIVKCISADGKVEYRDPPCLGRTRGAWVRTRSESQTHGGESAAAIERRALAIREAQHRADQAAIAARAQAAGAAATAPATPSSGGGCPPSVSSCPRRR